MTSPRHLAHRFNDPQVLAQSTLHRFEQLVIFVPLSPGHQVPAMGTRLSLTLTLPDCSTPSSTVTAQVCCWLNPRNNPDNRWLGLLIHEDNDNDIEARIRRLTHDYQTEYGKLIGSIFR